MIVAMQDMRSSYYQSDPRLLPTDIHDTDEHFQNNGICLRNIGGGYFPTWRYPSFSHILPAGFLGC